MKSMTLNAIRHQIIAMSGIKAPLNGIPACVVDEAVKTDGWCLVGLRTLSIIRWMNWASQMVAKTKMKVEIVIAVAVVG